MKIWFEEENNKVVIVTYNKDDFNMAKILADLKKRGYAEIEVRDGDKCESKQS